MSQAEVLKKGLYCRELIYYVWTGRVVYQYKSNQTILKSPVLPIKRVSFPYMRKERGLIYQILPIIKVSKTTPRLPWLFFFTKRINKIKQKMFLYSYEFCDPKTSIKIVFLYSKPGIECSWKPEMVSNLKQFGLQFNWHISVFLFTFSVYIMLGKPPK